MTRPPQGTPPAVGLPALPGRHRAAQRTRRPGRARLRWGLAAVAAIAGTVALTVPPDAAPRSAAAASAPTAEGTAVQLQSQAPRTGAAAPVRVRLPAIGVDSTLVDLDVDGAGVLVPPSDFGSAGWYSRGPVPGEVGPSVIAGHVDSYRGPAVFFRLGELAPGDDVLVDRADGTAVHFIVSDTQRFPKDAFPTEEVYGPTAQPVLRLITCGGQFDRDLRSYRDNVVVTAVLA